jgi:hypothetical protein
MNYLMNTNWLVVGAIMLATVSNAEDYYVSIKFNISQTNFAAVAHGSNQKESYINKVKYWDAKCTVGLNTWLIESDFTPGITSTYYFDGTHVYKTTSINPNTRSKNKAAVSKDLKNLLPLVSYEEAKGEVMIPLTITPGSHPLDDGGANLPWLAFCSGRYLRVPGRIVPRAGADIRHYPGAFGFQDQTVTFDDSLGLPYKLELFASLKLLQQATVHHSLIRAGSPGRLQLALSPNISAPQGFLAARYEALAETNFAGWNLPVKFKYEQFLPLETGQSITTVILLGEVTSIHRSIYPPSSIVSSEKRYSVVDYRFRHHRKLVDEIHYILDKSEVKPSSDPELQRIYRAAVAAAPIDPMIKGKYGIYGLFATLIAGPAVAVFWRFISKTRKEKKIKQTP